MSLSLPRSTPEAQGVNPAGILGFIDAVEQAGLELHSLMVLRHGSVVASGWWKPYAPELPHMLFSLSKSFTSTAVGFAVSEGLLSVDDPVLKFFPEAQPVTPDRYWPELKVKHLLCMGTGHTADTTGYMVSRKDGDWVKGFFSRPLRRKPGTHFLYNTGATYMLSVIVQKLTGQRVLDYLTPRLFAPLGIEGATWEQCPKGYDTGGFGLKVKTEDIAKFGQFLLQRGQWQGKELLPAAWVDEATGKQIDNGNADGSSDWGMGYGYQFWRCIPGCYRGDGAFGQYCIVLPAQDAVVAITSGLGDMQAVLKLLWQHLLPAISDAQTDDPAASAVLKDRLSALKYDPPAQQVASPREEAVSGRTYRLSRNRQKLTRIGFAFSPDRCDMTLNVGKSSTTLSCGRGAWLESTHAPTMDANILPLGSVKTVGSFTWEDDDTLVMTGRDVCAPFMTTIRVRFTGDGLEMTVRVNVSFGPAELPVIKGTPSR